MTHAGAHVGAHGRGADLSAGNIRLEAGAAGGLSAVGIGLVAGVVGIGGAALVAWLRGTDGGLFFRAWLQNFLFVTSLALGGLFFVLIQHLTRAGWSVAVRRVAEAFALNLRWIWLLFLPIAALAVTGRLGMLFPWADLDSLRAVAPAEADLVAGKSAYLNQLFFWIRSIAYFVVWAALGWYFWSSSVRQDAEGGVALTQRMQRMSAPAILLFGVTVTFASVDWIMSLNPAWFSTMFGVYFFAACCTGGFAAMIIATVALLRRGKLVGIVTPEHLQDMGKLLFAFGMVFWAYIAFSQYMLIWYANIPEETGWYLARQIGDWKWLSLFLLFGHFVIPFLLLISKHPKRLPATLVFVSAWMLLCHWLDLYWLIMPQIPHDLAKATDYAEFAAKHAETPTHLADPVHWLLLVGMTGLFVAFTTRALQAHSLLPQRDPRLHESLAFENM